jgi:hypothetical protein
MIAVPLYLTVFCLLSRRDGKSFTAAVRRQEPKRNYTAVREMYPPGDMYCAAACISAQNSDRRMKHKPTAASINTAQRRLSFYRCNGQKHLLSANINEKLILRHANGHNNRVGALISHSHDLLH